MLMNELLPKRVPASPAALRGRCDGGHRTDPKLSPLAELNYLLAVGDFSRIAALRLRGPDGTWYRTVPESQAHCPTIDRTYCSRGSEGNQNEELEITRIRTGLLNTSTGKRLCE